MKRTLLSTALIVTFGVYTLFERTGGASTVYTATPKGNGSTSVVLFSRNEDASTSNTEVPIKETDPVAIAPEKQTTKPTPTKTTSTPAKTTPTSKPAPTTTPPPVKTSTGLYRDGEYTGNSADAYYGFVQVKAIISGGKISDVQFLSYPNDRGTSIEINTQAMPYLISEAIQAQSAQVDTVSGASETSGAFRESLATALAKAKN